MSYTPKPIDVSHVTLSSELNELVERVAENVHELWAQQRMKDGWNWGPKRDDAAKQHPGLVPYSELSDSEKEYRPDHHSRRNGIDPRAGVSSRTAAMKQQRQLLP